MNPLLNDKQFDDRFLLSGRMEILSVLNDLIRSRAAVTVHLNRGRDVLLTNLLDARGQTLVFDVGSDEEINRKLESSPECLCVASHNGIRVRFTVVSPKRFLWDDLAAYQAPIPATLLRLQRRETHRMLLSVTKPVLIAIEKLVAAHTDTPDKPQQFPMHDLSVEGAGFTVQSEMLFRVGDALSIAFPLSKATNMRCHALVRHVTHVGESNSKKNYRVGIAFQQLPGKFQVAVQRYLTEIALQRRHVSKE